MNLKTIEVDLNNLDLKKSKQETIRNTNRIYMNSKIDNML